MAIRFTQSLFYLPVEYGVRVPGYREEGGVTPDSTTETFAAVKLHLETSRWTDVPFYRRSGKQLPALATEIAIQFKQPPLRLFGIASWISIVTGGLGLYYHGVAVARYLESPLELLDIQVLFAVLPHAPPLGAPMAFVGMGVLGLLVHTCALKLEHLVRPRSLMANVGFALAFLLLVLAPLSPMLIHVLF